MAKKRSIPEKSADSVLVTAAKTIGKAAGKIAAVVTGTAKATADTEQGPKATKRLAKMGRKAVTKKRVATRTKKSAEVSKAKSTTPKSKIV